MFKFVIDRQELVDDKKSMFGIFTKNPSLLTILPGLEPVLKRFIGKVEDIIPKKSIGTRSSEKMSVRKREQPNSSSSSNTSNALNTEIPTVEDLEERFMKWAKKQVQTKNKDIDDEELRKSFKIKATSNKSFEFTCLQVNCYLPFVLKYLDKSEDTNRTSKINMGNIHRHITSTCWLSEKKSTLKFKSSSSAKSTNFFKSKVSLTETKSNNEGLTDRTFIPKHPSDTDISIESPSLKYTKVGTKDNHTEVNSLETEIQLDNTSTTAESQFVSPENSKNLQAPVGQIVHTETDGRIQNVALPTAPENGIQEISVIKGSC